MNSSQASLGPALGLQNLQGLRLVVQLLGGMLVIATAVVFFVHPNLAVDATEAVEGQEPTDLTKPLLGALIMMIPLEWVAFIAVRKHLRKVLAVEVQDQPYRKGRPLPSSFVTICIIGAALTAGVGFFGAIIHLITGSAIALAVAGVAALALFLQSPQDDSLHGI